MTPEQFLQVEIRDGLCSDNPRFVTLARKTISQIAHLNKMKAIDYGAGTGVYANELMQAGFDVVAQDVWKAHRDHMAKCFPGLNVIDRPIRAELMLFIEVAEHMRDSEIDQAIAAIQPEIILFSSTSTPTANDKEWGHINLKEQAAWDSFWKMRGYDKIKNLKVPTPWARMYQKT